MYTFLAVNKNDFRLKQEQTGSQVNLISTRIAVLLSFKEMSSLITISGIGE